MKKTRDSVVISYRYMAVGKIFDSADPFKLKQLEAFVKKKKRKRKST